MDSSRDRQIRWGSVVKYLYDMSNTLIITNYFVLVKLLFECNIMMHIEFYLKILNNFPFFEEIGQ